MKISIVTHNYPTKKNRSSGIFIQKEARQLAEIFEINLYLPRVYSTPLNKQYFRNLEPVDENFPVYSFNYLSLPRRKFPKITQWSLSINLLSSIQNSSPDLVHLHGLFPSGLCAPILKKHKYPVALTIHGSDWYTNLKQGKLPGIFNEILKNCDLIITVGNQLKRDICKMYPELERSIHYVPHGIDTENFLPPKDKNDVKKHLGWDQSKINLLSVANFYEVKGVHILIKAFNELDNKDNYHLHIISPHFDKKYKDEALKFIQENELGRYVTFYNSMPEEEIISYFQAADLFISSSLKEAFGLAIAESAACGTPVIATKSGGPENILTKEIGSLVPPDDVDSLTETMERVSNQLNQFSPQKMHQSIVDRYSISAKQLHMKTLYQSILK